jgi:hypothetical protein
MGIDKFEVGASGLIVFGCPNLAMLESSLISAIYRIVMRFANRRIRTLSDYRLLDALERQDARMEAVRAEFQSQPGEWMLT